MGLRINTNIAAIDAQRHLYSNQKRLQHAEESLASGNRIVHASDDPAGLAISSELGAQVGSLKMAKQNASNAQSMIQIGEGGLNQISNILIRLRELAVEAASDTVSDRDRKYLNIEAQQLTKESNRIAMSTRFGHRRLLTGDAGQMVFQVGPYNSHNDEIRANVSADATNSALGIDGLSVADKDSARDTLSSVDEALNRINKMRADFGAVQSRLQSVNSSVETEYENVSAARSRIADADVAYESSQLASAEVLRQAAISTLAQANTNNEAALKLINE